MDDPPRPSAMQRKFMQAALNPPDPNKKPQPKTLTYFFYDALMDPSTLGSVLQRSQPPEVKHAVIYGTPLKLWGEYPAFLDEDGEHIIHGVTCEIDSWEEVIRLDAYETEKYQTTGSLIYFDDGTETCGLVYYWFGDRALLSDGTFDLEDWLLKRREGDIYNSK